MMCERGGMSTTWLGWVRAAIRSGLFRGYSALGWRRVVWEGRVAWEGKEVCAVGEEGGVLDLRRAYRDRPLPPRSAPSTAEYPARMFAVVDRGTARTPWEFSLGFGSSGATGALFPKNPKQPRCQHPVVRAPARAAPRCITLRSAR